MDFKAQIAKDMAVFNNADEFATVTTLWYEGNEYTVPVIFDHEAAVERQKTEASGMDHAEGINNVEVLAHIAFNDLGFLPKRNRLLEVETDTSTFNKTYTIYKSDYEDGEIILELGVLEE